MAEHEVTVVIIGAGQAGLAMAHELQQTQIVDPSELLIIDAGQPADLSWRRKWDSLKLFTPAWYSHLPGMNLPGDPRRYPEATEVATYLDAYREALGVRTLWGTRATEVRVGLPGFVVPTSEGDIAAQIVIVATGPFGAPRFPSFAEQVRVRGVAVHSDAYRRPSQLLAGPVLVVGSGNTGLQIASELAPTHCVSIARGSHQPRLPQRFLGIDIFRWLSLTGTLSIPADSRLGRRMADREFTIGRDLSDLASLGVHVLPRAIDAHDDQVYFEGGHRRAFESVIWATGYHPGFRRLGSAATTASDPDWQTPYPHGVYRIGGPWMSSRASALLGGVGRDARRIAAVVARQLTGREAQR